MLLLSGGGEMEGLFWAHSKHAAIHNAMQAFHLLYQRDVGSVCNLLSP